MAFWIQMVQIQFKLSNTWHTTFFVFQVHFYLSFAHTHDRALWIQILQTQTGFWQVSVHHPKQQASCSRYISRSSATHDWFSVTQSQLKLLTYIMQNQYTILFTQPWHFLMYHHLEDVSLSVVRNSKLPCNGRVCLLQVQEFHVTKKSKLIKNN